MVSVQVGNNTQTVEEIMERVTRYIPDFNPSHHSLQDTIIMLCDELDTAYQQFADSVLLREQYEKKYMKVVYELEHLKSGMPDWMTEKWHKAETDK